MTFRSLVLAVFLILTLLPLGWNKFDTGRNAELIYLAGALLPILLVFSWKAIREQTKSFWAEKITLLLFFAVVVASFLLSPIKNYGWSEVVVTGMGIVAYFITQTFSESERKFFINIVWGLTLISVAVAMYWYLNISENRMAGLFFDLDKKAHFWPNAFALFLLMTWPLIFITFAKKWNYGSSMVLGLMVSALVLTFSRAAFLTFLVQIGVLAILMKGKNVVKQNKKYILVSIFVALVAVFGLHQWRAERTQFSTNSFIQKIVFEGTERQTSVIERSQFFKGGLHFVKEKPLLGHGPNSFRYLYPEIQPEFLAISDHPHNWYLKIAMDSGLLAALSFLIFLGLIFWQILKAAPPRSDHRPTTIYFLAILGPLVHGLFDYNLNFLTNAFLFWILLGFLQGTLQTSVSKDGATRLFWATRILPVIVLMLTVTLSVSTLSEGYLSYKLRNADDDTFYQQAQFPREYWLNRARKEEKFDEKKRLVEIHLQKNPSDAWGWNYLGQVLEQQGKLEESYQAYKKAVELDPANFFAFYVEWFRVGNKIVIKDPDQIKYREKAITFLKTYPEKIRQNVHYTAQSTNPVYATELAKLLGEEALAQEIVRYSR